MYWNYFHSHKSTVFALLLIGACLNSMEEEAIPLLNGEDAIISAHDLEGMYIGDLDELPSGFYNGERKYYDEDAYKKAKCKACKRCTLFTTLFALAGGAGMSGLAFIINTIILAAVNLSPEAVGTVTQRLMAIEGIGGAIITGMAGGIHRYGVERTKLESKSLSSSAQLPLDLLTYPLDDTQLICRARDTYQTLLTPPKHRFEFLSTFFANSRKMLSIQHAIESRNPPVRFEYAKVGYELKQVLLDKLKKDPTKKIFSYFPEQNILLHIMGHLEKSKWSHDVFLATEKEFMSLAFLKTLNMNGYSLVSELAKYGWCSFEKSEKYPIRIDWLYFDRQALERDNVNTHYGSLISLDELRPRAFMPCCKELVKYYKFEEDPAYEAEFKRPSNPKIKKLLIHRKNFLEKKYGPSLPFELEPDLNNTN